MAPLTPRLKILSGKSCQLVLYLFSALSFGCSPVPSAAWLVRTGFWISKNEASAQKEWAFASLTPDPPPSQLSPDALRHHHSFFFLSLSYRDGRGTATYAPSPAPPDMSDYELMNVVTVGGNPVSAFLSWRLQATNACDVTLVWKTGFEHVSQYGISFKYALRARPLPPCRLPC
jgi:hypothetical protein